MKFYGVIPDMEFLSGDTLPAFHVQVEGTTQSGSTMECIISKAEAPNTAVITKECTAEDGGFAVQLTSEDTTLLTEGLYLIHFRLISGGFSFRKLLGKMYVHSVAIGGVDNE